MGGYLEACGGSSGNVGSFWNYTLEEATNTCCENLKCAGFSYRASDGSGYFKGNQNCGEVADLQYDGYTKPSQMPGGGKADITVTFSDVGLSGRVKVYDIWAQRQVGEFQYSFTAQNIPVHGTAFLRLSAASPLVV